MTHVYVHVLHLHLLDIGQNMISTVTDIVNCGDDQKTLNCLMLHAITDMSCGTGCMCGVPVLSVTYQMCCYDHRL